MDDERPDIATFNPTQTRQEELTYRLWNVFLDQSKYDPEIGAWVWVGKTTEIKDLLGVSQPYTSVLMSHLGRMGCINSVRRGGGGSPSVIALLKTPHHGLWETGNNPAGKLTKPEQDRQMVRDLNRRVANLESTVQALLAWQQQQQAVQEYNS